MKIQTNNLIGEALNWAVSAAQGDSDVHPYSTHWSDGGPIIEAVGITLMYCEGEYIAGTNPECFDDQVFMYHEQYGPTPLIAAMRCYVASKLGHEVEVPEELK